MLAIRQVRLFRVNLPDPCFAVRCSQGMSISHSIPADLFAGMIMKPKIVHSRFNHLWSLVVLIPLWLSCSNEYDLTGVNSPEPGLLKVYIQADNAENYTIIAGDTMRVGTGDSLALQIGAGRAYRGSDYAILYKELSDFRETSKTVNILQQQQNGFIENMIFETWLPPVRFDSLKIYIIADFIRLGYYEIPIVTATDASSFMRFDSSFIIYENKTTEIHLQIKPFSSLVRVGDSYHFRGKIAISQIRYL
jgi:hypothetical protein